MNDDSFPGPLAHFHMYLRQRRPASLVADGFIMLIVYAVISHVYTSARDATPLPQRSEAAGSLFEASMRLTTLMESLATFLFYAAFFLLAWGVARLLADAVGGRVKDEG